MKNLVLESSERVATAVRDLKAGAHECARLGDALRIQLDRMEACARAIAQENLCPREAAELASRVERLRQRFNGMEILTTCQIAIPKDIEAVWQKLP